jgi:hypothetical protein
MTKETKVTEQPVGQQYRESLVYLLIKAHKKWAQEDQKYKEYVEWLLNKPKKDVIQFASMSDMFDA